MRNGPGVSPADQAGMGVALEEAQRAAKDGEVPVGAAIYGHGVLVSRARNEMAAKEDPTAHAEIRAIRRALKMLHADRLDDCTLYVTLEPCAQCAGAIVLAKVGRVVYGAADPKAGMAGSVGDLLRNPKLNHRAEVVGGVAEEECAALLKNFFAGKRGR
ncbi:MAG TPA: tRNA adenosine(34) deaminase TadA [Gemmatimonadales bacterium]|nr:tRNA adenosine(34) deaminase TadA [Gemmatimonadales bacterium]